MSRTSAPRIVSGRWKGRALRVPAGARPTSSRAREALFDILQETVPGSRVLDLFSGSGAVGLEALSRGAIRVSFVEGDSRALESNLAALGAGPDEFELLRVDSREAVATLARRGEKFDLVFADPPYGLKEGLSRSVAGLLTPGGRLVLQTDASAEPGEFPALVLAGRRAYGRNVFWFYEPRKA